MSSPLQRRLLPNPFTVHTQMIPALLLTLLGWALSFFQITLPMGLGIRLQMAPIAGLLAAAYVGGPVVGAILGLIIGSSTFGSLWLPNALAYTAGLALAGWLLRKAKARQGWRLYLRQAGVALLCQGLLALVLAGGYALANLDLILFSAAGAVLAIALLPGAIFSALLFPLLVKPYGIRYIAPTLLILAVAITFAMHPTVLPRENMLAASDFVAGLRDEVGRQLGGVTLFINGAQGDVVPRIAEGSARDFLAARAVGSRIGGEATALLTGASRITLPASARLSIDHEPIEFPLANWGFQALSSLNLLRYQQYLAGALPTMQSRISLIRLGESVAMLTAPGETTTRLGLRLESQITARAPFFLGLTHDSLGYLMPKDEWLTGRNDNYEESVSVGPRAGELYAKAAQRLLSRGTRRERLAPPSLPLP